MKLLSTIPPFSNIEAVNNRPFSIGKLREQCVTVFYFWSQDCSLCKSMPTYLQRIIDRFGSQVQCIVVHDGPLVKKEFPKVEGAVLLIDNRQQLGDLFQLKQVPAVFLFDQQQQLRFKQTGAADLHLLLRRIERFL